MPPSPRPSPKTPEYCPCAWAGASRYRNSSEPAACHSSPTVCTPTPSKITAMASHQGIPAVVAIKPMPIRNATPARRMARVAAELVSIPRLALAHLLI
jgi:hypothetical protein